MNDPTTIRRLYGRSKGRPLRQGQAALVEELLPALSVPDEGPISAAGLFGDERALHFEIGFGGGEHLAYRADLLPDHGFIAAIWDTDQWTQNDHVFKGKSQCCGRWNSGDN